MLFLFLVEFQSYRFVASTAALFLSLFLSNFLTHNHFSLARCRTPIYGKTKTRRTQAKYILSFCRFVLWMYVFFFFFILLLLLGTHTHTLTLRGERFFIFFFRSVRSINFFCEDLGSYISVSGVVVCIQYFDVASYRNALRIVFQIMSRQFSKSFDIDVTYMYTKNFTLKSV